MNYVIQYPKQNCPNFSKSLYIDPETLKKIEEFTNQMKLEEKAKKNKPEYHCRICGSNEMVLEQEPKLCNLCKGALEKQLWEDKVRAVVEGRRDCCQKCYSHIDACTCPESKAMRELKK